MKFRNIFQKKNSLPKTTFSVVGMHCASCAAMIESELEDAGYKTTCSYAKQTLEIEGNDIDKKAVKTAVKKAGYDILI